MRGELYHEAKLNHVPIDAARSDFGVGMATAAMTDSGTPSATAQRSDAWSSVIPKELAMVGAYHGASTEAGRRVPNAGKARASSVLDFLGGFDAVPCYAGGIDLDLGQAFKGATRRYKALQGSIPLSCTRSREKGDNNDRC